MIKPSNKFLSYLRRAQDAGLNPERILDGSGISWQEVETSKPIDVAVMAQLFDFLARRTPADFAFTCGKATKISDFGIVGLAMASAPTLRDALDRWSRYSIVALQPFATSITERGNQWQMHFSPQRLMSSDAVRFCMEASIAANEAIIAELTGVPAGTTMIEFAFEHPASTEHYNAFRTSAIHFGRPITIYHGNRQDLDRLIPLGDKETADAYQSEYDNFLVEIAGSRSINDEIENIIRGSKGRIPSVDEMATTLGLSRRSFQRELERQQTSYLDLVRNFRIRHATRLLNQNNFNVKETAYLLGFQNAGNFRRAFQTWMGQSLGDWQNNSISGQIRTDITHLPLPSSEPPTYE